MIGRLTGQFAGVRSDGAALIDVGGVGYVVAVSLSTLEGLKGKDRVSLHVHTAVKEDAIDLYGFPAEEELAFFRMLLSVSGIGPKTALSIMNIADVRSLKNAIAGGDSSYLTKVFGVGKKSAERIVVELKDKLVKEGYSSAASSGGDSEVLDALISLGYKADVARGAVASLSKKLVGTSERLKEALKALGSS